MSFADDFILRNATLGPGFGKKVRLTWQDVQWAYGKGMLGWRLPVKLAESIVDIGPSSEDEMELSTLDKDHDWRVQEILEQLAGAEGAAAISSQEKWLYLSLLWLLENLGSFDNPFMELQSIQDDFGFPEEVRDFLRWYEPEGVDLENALAAWKRYLVSSRAKLSAL
jgi:hypothetical protein